jgi:phosphoribosyl 1,2-cyclic phosphodiesterase
MLKLTPLFSSSKGNCTYIETDTTSLLVDIGISCKRLVTKLAELNINPETIEAILITHEHSDHVKGIKVFASKYKIPVYATEKTWDYLKTSISLPENQTRIFVPNYCFNIGNIKVHPFNIPHDAVDPCGFSFYCTNEKVTVATDLGCINEYLISNMIQSNSILIESNHDINMLKTGPYPWALKQRIIGNRGHLSNVTSAQLIEILVKNGTKNFILGHLSEENNFPELAKETVCSHLKINNINISELNINVAKP